MFPLARFARVGFAIALLAALPSALAQKMYKCSDGKGGTVFQQSVCPETAQEAEARQKERERIEAEAQKKKDDEARRREAAIQKARERDQAYQRQLEERKRTEQAQQRVLGGGSGKDDGDLPEHVAQTYPGPWRSDAHAAIAASLGKKQVADCSQFRYRPRAGVATEFLVNCTSGAAKNVHYFVWPQTDSVRGPVKF